MLRPRWCCLQRLCAAYINLQRSFFCSARVEYFSNECFIFWLRPSNEHTSRDKHMEMKSSRRKRALQRPRDTHKVVQTSSAFVFYIALFSLLMYEHLCTQIQISEYWVHTHTHQKYSLHLPLSWWHKTCKQPTKKIKTLKFLGRQNMQDVKTKPPKTAQTCV